MANDFDPYYTWLGIPPEDQPADHYRLLGLKRFEANAEVISNVSDQRMGHLRTLQTGKRAAESQKLLNELAAATRVLLDPAQKKKYDAELKSQLAAATPPVAKRAVAKPLPAAQVEEKSAAANKPEVPASPTAPFIVTGEVAKRELPSVEKIRPSEKASSSLVTAVVVASVVGVVLALGGVVWFLNSGPGTAVVVPPDSEVAATDPPAGEDPPKPVEEGNGNVTPPAPPAGDVITKYWSYARSPEGFAGVIREHSTGVWIELRSDGKVSYFTEKGRQGATLTLFDSSRRLTFQLDATNMKFQREGGDSWNHVMDGQWTATEPGVTNSFRPETGTVSLLGLDWFKLKREGAMLKATQGWLLGPAPEEEANGGGKGDAYVEFPLVPQGDYMLDMVVQRMSGSHTFKILCPHSNKSLHLVLDANNHDQQVYCSGVNYVKGEHLFARAEKKDPGVVQRSDMLFTPGKAVPLTVVVRKNEVMIWMNGTRVLDWQGEFSTIENDPKFVPPTDPQRLALVASGSGFEFSRVVFRPLMLPNGAGESTPPKSATEPTRQLAAYMFPGGGSHVGFNNVPDTFTPGQPFTVEFWYRNYGSVLESPSLASFGDLQFVTLPGDKHPEQRRRYAFRVGDTTAAGAEFSLDNSWHHLALVGFENELSLSVDGKPYMAVPWSELNAERLTPALLGAARSSGESPQSLVGLVRSLTWSTTSLYPAREEFTPPSRSKGSLLPPNTTLAFVNGARTLSGTSDPTFSQFAGLAGRTNIAANVGTSKPPTVPSGSNPSSGSSGSPTPSPSQGNAPEEPMRAKRDLLLALQDGARISLEFPAGTFASNKQATVEYWWRRPTNLIGYFPLFHMDDLTIFLQKPTAESISMLYLQGPSSSTNTGMQLQSREWHHVVWQFYGGEFEVFIDGAPTARFSSAVVSARGPERVIEIGQGMRRGSSHQLGGEIRSLRASSTLLYKERPERFEYTTADHGLLLPVAVKLKLENVEVRNADGSQPPRNTLADLLDPHAGQRVATPKLPPPDKEKLEVAKGTVATLFGSKAKVAIKPEQKQELCDELLQASIAETDVPLAFALLGEARTQAVGSASLDHLLRVVDEVERRFVIDRVSFQGRLLTEMNATKLATEVREELAIEAMQTAVQALYLEKVALADSLSELASNCVKTSKNVELKKAFRIHRDQIVVAKTLFDQLEKSLATLAQTPDNTAANLLAGRYYALTLQNFEKGLPYLSKSGDTAAALAAKQELEAKTPEQKMSATEAWLTAAGNLKAHEKVAVQRHALLNYELLAQQSMGLIQTRAKQRVEELQKELADLEKLVEAAKNFKRATKPQPGLICRLTVGDYRTRVPTPYLAVVRGREDIFRINWYTYYRGYSTSYHGYSLSGLIMIDKDMEVIINLNDCQCSLNGQLYDANRTPIINSRVAVKKGTYPIQILSSYYETPGFQVNRADTGESLLFYTPELLDREINLPAALANGLPSKGLRIDQNNNDINNN
jgi:hypothetical protein